MYDIIIISIHKGGVFLNSKKTELLNRIKHGYTHSIETVQAKLAQYKKVVSTKTDVIKQNSQVQSVRKKLDNYTKVEASRTQEEVVVHLKRLNYAVIGFSGLVMIGLSAGMFALAQPSTMPDQFEERMTSSIETGFGYDVSMNNTENGKMSYYLPKQFEYRYSLGVNDIIKFKGNQVIMHYNEAYSVVGQDVETYYLLRDENKLAGEEVYYQNLQHDKNNGFVQLVKLAEDYLLTVFLDGVKMSTILSYDAAPSMTHHMLLIGKSVSPYTPVYAKVEEVPAAPESDHATTEGLETDEQPETTEGELSTTQSEQTIQFDFSSETRENSEQTEEDQTESEE